MRAFNVGDQVRIGDTVGNIVDKSILVTRIRTNKNVEVTVPNSMILKTHVMNYSSSVNQGNNLILHTKINISYNVPWRKVHELLINAALSTRHVLKEPQPFVLQNSLDNFCASYELNAYTDEPNIMVQTYSDLHQNIQDKFNEANIEITSTSYISIRDSDQITSQKEYLPESDKTHTSEITSDENKPTLK
jgi:small-conductance mechanosensitive channel